MKVDGVDERLKEVAGRLMTGLRGRGRVKRVLKGELKGSRRRGSKSGGEGSKREDEGVGRGGIEREGSTKGHD